MNLPPRYRAFDLASWPFGIQCDSKGKPQLPRTSAYPPFGYRPLSLFEVGNGDACGFYWPIGREDQDPLVCELHHDDEYLEPQAMSLESLACLRVLQGWDDEEEIELLADTLGVSLPDSPDEPLEWPEIPLDIVSDSPAAWRAQAQAAFNRGDLAESERLVREALRLFPEYTDARLLLVKVLRRAQRIDEAIPEMIETFCSPYAFGRGQEECLRWLQRLPDTADAALRDDPIWTHRNDLTLATGVKSNEDFPLYEQIIAEYLRRGLGKRAVRLRYVVGELYSRETTAFRERYGYSDAEHFRRLEQELMAAGFHTRAEALRNAESYP